MIDNISDLVLDGNATACLVQDTFGADITLAKIRCEACDCITSVGCLALYGAPMAAVLTCADCDSTLMRVVRTPHGLWLEMTGTRYLRF